MDKCRENNPTDFGKLDDYMHQFKGRSSRYIKRNQKLV